MADLHSRLQARSWRFRGAQDAWDGMLERAARRERVRRMGSAVFALALFVGMATGLWVAFAPMRSQVIPAGPAGAVTNSSVPGGGLIPSVGATDPAGGATTGSNDASRSGESSGGRPGVPGLDLSLPGGSRPWGGGIGPGGVSGPGAGPGSGSGGSGGSPGSGSGSGGSGSGSGSGGPGSGSGGSGGGGGATDPGNGPPGGGHKPPGGISYCSGLAVPDHPRHCRRSPLPAPTGRSGGILFAANGLDGRARVGPIPLR